MGSRLAIRFILPPELASTRVPPLLLQPLVENSVKHGLEPKREGGRIDVAAACEGTHLVLRVRDTGVGPGREAQAGAGFGLAAVRERLETSYGVSAAFAIEAADDDAEGGTLATVRVPLAMPPTAVGARHRRAA